MRPDIRAEIDVLCAIKMPKRHGTFLYCYVYVQADLLINGRESQLSGKLWMMLRTAAENILRLKLDGVLLVARCNTLSA